MKETTSVMPSPWWSIRDVAARWQVCDRTVRRHIDSGLLPARKLGGLIRINEQDLRSFEYRLPIQSTDIK
jgi:excisionase family DNA binding protein